MASIISCALSDNAGRHCLELPPDCGRRRRRRPRGVGRHARLRFRSRRARGRCAGAFDLWRKNHDRAAPRRTRARCAARHSFRLHGSAWTQDAALPGGDIDPPFFEDFLGASEEAEKPFLSPAALALRLARAYGARALPLSCAPHNRWRISAAEFGQGLTEAKTALSHRE